LISNKTIFIAHSWSDVSLNLQSKALALAFSENNKVFFLNAKKTGNAVVNINEKLVVLEWPGKRPVGWKDFWFAVKQVRRHKPDIIITNFAANDIMLFVSWIFRVKTRVAYFHTMVQQHIEDYHAIDIRQRINIFRKGFVFRMATHMLASSVAAKKDLMHYYKVRDSNVYVFPNALPDTNARNKGANNKIGFLGRLDRSKGVDILIAAFKKLSEKFTNAELIIVGKGKDEQVLRKKVQELDLKDKVLFKGSVAYAGVLDFLVSLNFLVVPSRMDNLPTVALEALSAGTPVVGSNAGGIPDIIEDGYNGLLFENENSDILSEKMDWLFQNTEERNRISANARKSFEAKYRMNELPARFEMIIEKNT